MVCSIHPHGSHGNKIDAWSTLGHMYGPITDGDRFSEALILLQLRMKHMQSLATFISFSLRGMSSGMTLIIHIRAARFYCAHQKTYLCGTIEPDRIKTIQTESKAYGHSATSFPLPADSLS